MPSGLPGKSQLPLDGFLDFLRLKGFHPGVGHHIRAHALYERLGPMVVLGEFKTLLAPLFAHDARSQEDFYKAFDQYFASGPMAGEPSKPARAARRSRRTGFPIYVAGAFVIAALAAVALLHFHHGPIPIAMAGDEAAGTEIPVSGPVVPVVSDSSLPAQVPEAAQGGKPSPGGIFAPLDPTTAIPTIRVHREEAAPGWAARMEQLNKDEIPGRRRTFLDRHPHAIQLSVCGILLFLLIVYEGFRYWRRTLAINRRLSQTPPLVWPIKAPEIPLTFFQSEDFHRSTRKLCLRQEESFVWLNMERTVKATIEQAGRPQIVFEAYTKPPDYLALVDFSTFRDHQGSLFEAQLEAMRKDGMLITGLRFRQNPRVCWSQADRKNYSLVELQKRFPGSRLLIYSDGSGFVNPQTGELQPWTRMLTFWSERAILTPEPPTSWGDKGRTLRNRFRLLPATVEGLESLPSFYTDSERSYPVPINPIGEERYWSEDDWQRPDNLKRYLGTIPYQWLAGCAVYPELHWSLSVYIGSLECFPASLLSEENILRMFRIPWFRFGLIPEGLRFRLIEDLDPGKGLIVRKALVEVLRRDPPSERSVARENQDMNLAVLDLWLNRSNPAEKRKLVQKVRDLARRQPLQNSVLLRSLESQHRNRLDFILPAALKRIFYRNGIAALGLRPSLRILMEFLVLLAAFIALTPEPPEKPAPAFPLLIAVNPDSIRNKSGNPFQVPQANGESISLPVAFSRAPTSNSEFAYFLNRSRAFSDSSDMDARLALELNHDFYKDRGKFHPKRGKSRLPTQVIIPGYATLYCKWLAQSTGLPFRLPTPGEARFLREYFRLKRPMLVMDSLGKVASFPVGETAPADLRIMASPSPYLTGRWDAPMEALPFNEWDNDPFIVSWTQNLLLDLGYKDVRVNGVFDSSNYAALMDFRRSIGPELSRKSYPDPAMNWREEWLLLESKSDSEFRRLTAGGSSREALLAEAVAIASRQTLPGDGLDFIHRLFRMAAESSGTVNPFPEAHARERFLDVTEMAGFRRVNMSELGYFKLPASPFRSKLLDRFDAGTVFLFTGGKANGSGGIVLSGDENLLVVAASGTRSGSGTQGSSLQRRHIQEIDGILVNIVDPEPSPAPVSTRRYAGQVIPGAVSPPQLPFDRVTATEVVEEYPSAIRQVASTMRKPFVVETVPTNARVLFNGEDVGRSPVAVDLFGANSMNMNDIWLSLNGYDWDYHHVGRATSERKRVYTLAKIDTGLGGGGVIIASTPPDARIFIDNKEVGTTPDRLKLPSGRWELSLAKPGYVGIDTVLTTSDMKGRLEFTLMKLEARLTSLSQTRGFGGKKMNFSAWYEGEPDSIYTWIDEKKKAIVLECRFCIDEARKPSLIDSTFSRFNLYGWDSIGSNSEPGRPRSMKNVRLVLYIDPKTYAKHGFKSEADIRENFQLYLNGEPVK